MKLYFFIFLIKEKKMNIEHIVFIILFEYEIFILNYFIHSLENYVFLFQLIKCMTFKMSCIVSLSG